MKLFLIAIYLSKPGRQTGHCEPYYIEVPYRNVFMKLHSGHQSVFFFLK